MSRDVNPQVLRDFERSSREHTKDLDGARKVEVQDNQRQKGKKEVHGDKIVVVLDYSLAATVR